MFSNSPFFSAYQGRRSGLLGAWWALMAPGLLLSLMAVAILIWPELLAYMVASVLLFVGVSLTLWGWSMRQVTAQQAKPTVFYEIR